MIDPKTWIGQADYPSTHAAVREVVSGYRVDAARELLIAPFPTRIPITDFPGTVCRVDFVDHPGTLGCLVRRCG